MSAHQIGLLSDAALQTNRTKTTCGSEIFSYLRLPHADTSPSEERPLLVLLHGYPQTSYIWRHLLPSLPPSYPLFIPDLPGYGRSTPSLTTHDKLTIGLAILEALHTILPNPSPTTPIILIGHDRGARIAHRLALTFSHPPPLITTTATTTEPNPNPLPSFTLAALAVLDTVPEPAQWSSLASPPAAASSFHWPFLANTELATAMIEAFGARRWCATLLERWSGDGAGIKHPRVAAARSNVEGDDGDAAVEAYCAAFERPGVVRATCEDYAASVGPDKVMWEEDGREGRRVGLGGGRGVLVVYSEGYLGQKGARDVGGIWRGYVDEGTRLVQRGIGDGVGHFLVEEAPEVFAEVLVGWLEGRG